MSYFVRVCFSVILFWAAPAYSIDAPSHGTPEHAAAPSPTPSPGSAEELAGTLLIEAEDAERWESLIWVSSKGTEGSETKRVATGGEILQALDQLKLTEEEKDQALLLWANETLKLESRKSEVDPQKVAVVVGVLDLNASKKAMEKFGNYLGSLSEREKDEPLGQLRAEMKSQFDASVAARKKVAEFHASLKASAYNPPAVPQPLSPAFESEMARRREQETQARERAQADAPSKSDENYEHQIKVLRAQLQVLKSQQKLKKLMEKK